MTIAKIIKKFPKDFIFGTATSSYQVEGSSYGGCAENHWDTFSRKKNSTYKKQNGKIACEHFLHWETDLDLVAAAGFSAYRFSFSWPRILSDGKNQKNPEGISFYDRLLDGMLERNILPYGTLYHWDLPAVLAENGGWTNRDTCNWFANYSEIVSRHFGDRLHSIATVNEPWCIAWLSHYIGEHAPGLKDINAAVRSMHLILVAHAEACNALRSVGQKNIGIVLNKQYMAPATDSDEDISACNLSDEIYNLWFDEALFSNCYPKKTLKLFEKFMPKNFQDDLPRISQPIDWIGINYYTRAIVKAHKSEKNIGFKCFSGNLPKTDMSWEIFPEGLTLLIKRQIKNYSGSLPIHITENGMANRDDLENGIINDIGRINFYAIHLKKIGTLIAEEAPIKSYFAWSLLDNFEWAYGYEKRFGLVYIDFKSQNRVPKNSYYAFQEALKAE